MVGDRLRVPPADETFGAFREKLEVDGSAAVDRDQKEAADLRTEQRDRAGDHRHRHRQPARDQKQCAPGEDAIVVLARLQHAMHARGGERGHRRLREDRVGKAVVRTHQLLGKRVAADHPERHRQREREDRAEDRKPDRRLRPVLPAGERLAVLVAGHMGHDEQHDDAQRKKRVDEVQHQDRQRRPAEHEDRGQRREVRGDERGERGGRAERVHGCAMLRQTAGG